LKKREKELTLTHKDMHGRCFVGSFVSRSLSINQFSELKKMPSNLTVTDMHDIFSGGDEMRLNHAVPPHVTMEQFQL